MSSPLPRRACLGLVLALLAPAAWAADSCPPPPPDDLKAHLAEVNAFRASQGVAPLTLNAQLTAAAQGHADDMAKNNYFSHYSQDGRSPWDRIQAAGYTGWTALGENIAYGYATWHDALVAWENSPGHRANLLSPSFREIGLGVAKNAAGRAYYVQDFGARRTTSAPARASAAVAPADARIGESASARRR